MDKKLNQGAGEILKRVREKRPLLHHITNFVVMNDTANVTLHVGALPVMAHAREEMKEMTGIANALVLNIGTLSKEWIESMFIAGRKANSMRIPIILDPVGAGATKLRSSTSLELLSKLEIAVLRGNHGEIGAVAGAGGKVKGVESVEGIKDPVKVAQSLAKKYKTVVVITGKRDIVSSGKETYFVDNGDQWLSTNTGTGCMSTTMVAAFCAVEKNYAFASSAALACYGYAAEIAAKNAKGPASFKIALLDTLYNMSPSQLAKGAKIYAA
ncbi:hydroxyethylthiazole kinase [Patescibacteria group bacterium]|nr:hydroxyethylthiazole kinase [Patescibacteria group bacterium]